MGKFLDNMKDLLGMNKKSDVIVTKEAPKKKEEPKEKVKTKVNLPKPEDDPELARNQFVTAAEEKEEPKDYQEKPCDSKSDKGSEALKDGDSINKNIDKIDGVKPKELESVSLSADANGALKGDKSELKRDKEVPAGRNSGLFAQPSAKSVKDIEKVSITDNVGKGENSKLFVDRPAEAKKPSDTFESVGLSYNPKDKYQSGDNKKLFDVPLSSKTLFGPVKEKIDASTEKRVIKQAEGAGISLVKIAYVIEDQVVKDDAGSVVGYGEGATFTAEEATKIKTKMKANVLLWKNEQGAVTEGPYIFYSANPDVLDAWVKHAFPNPPTEQYEAGTWQKIGSKETKADLGELEIVPLKINPYEEKSKPSSILNKDIYKDNADGVGTEKRLSNSDLGIGPVNDSITASVEKKSKELGIDLIENKIEEEWEHSTILDNGWSIDYNWTGDENYDEELDDSNKEHVKNMIIEGYTNGELNQLDVDGNTEHRGWWMWRK